MYTQKNILHVVQVGGRLSKLAFFADPIFSLNLTTYFYNLLFFIFLLRRYIENVEKNTMFSKLNLNPY